MEFLSPTAFKHPKIYADLTTLYMLYWQQHQRLPKSFRFTTGERILTQLDDCMHAIIEANLVDKKTNQSVLRLLCYYGKYGLLLLWLGDFHTMLGD